MRANPEPSERLRAILERADAPESGPTSSAEAAAPPRSVPSIVTPPDVVTASRWQVSRRAAIGAGLVLLVAVAVLVGRSLLAERAAEPVPVAASPGVTTGGDRSGFSGSVPAAVPGATSSGPTGEVYVHVVGRVRSPGVVRVRAGSRVADAVAKAGGVGQSADAAQVNLARVVVDGEQIVVPAKGEQLAAMPGGAGPAAPGGAAAGGAVAGGSGDGVVSLNSADQTTLESLPGVGPVLAERIIEWRTTNGGFTTVEELNEVSGIGEKLFAQISPKVSV